MIRAMKQEAAPPGHPVPARVAILGYGPSLDDYVLLARQLGARGRLADEVWGVNALADVVHCDRIFHMDDVRVQEVRAAAAPDSNIAAMLAWFRTHPGPIYTSRAHPDYPGLVDYPLQDVLRDLGPAYFNSTIAYAIGYAIHIGVKSIQVFGADFTYPNSHQAEQGRACVEFWLGVAMMREIEVVVAERSSLLDTVIGRPLYGYGAMGSVDAEISYDDDGRPSVQFAERASLPTAAQIEAAYDHSKHPSPLVKDRKS
jgi:hypothetical protein